MVDTETGVNSRLFFRQITAEHDACQPEEEKFKMVKEVFSLTGLKEVLTSNTEPK